MMQILETFEETIPDAAPYKAIGLDAITKVSPTKFQV